MLVNRDYAISSFKKEKYQMCIRDRHSKKPDITQEKILALMGDLPRIELFARQHTPGWDLWGNEIKSDIRFAGKEV